MNFDGILIRYGELALKKKNRRLFEDKLMQNIRDKVSTFPNVRLHKEPGRLFLELGGHEHEPVLEKCKEVFGLVGFAPAMRVESKLEILQETALVLAESTQETASSFKVKAKRSNKQFHLDSQELNQKIGGYVLRNTQHLHVNVKKPDLLIHVEVRGEFSYVYGNDILGLGGLPVGTSGKVMLLLSGGIDSPVAGYLASKRGVELHAVHFHSYPFTSERAKQKVIDLAKLLPRYTGQIHLHIVPFTEIQTAINQYCLSSYSVTVMRRFMLRIAEEIAKQNNCLAMVTGESLGQVASQTIESMYTINAVTQYPILRPLIAMDKVQIMNIAKEIGTYETSILPYEDCCTVFLPKSPKTKPPLHATEKQESFLDVASLVNQAVAGTETIVCKESDEDEFNFY